MSEPREEHRDQGTEAAHDQQGTEETVFEGYARRILAITEEHERAIRARRREIKKLVERGDK